MDRALRPAPRLDARLLDAEGRALSYAGASRACAAAGLTLDALLSGHETQTGDPQEAAIVALLDQPSQARMSRLSAPLREAVMVALLDRIGSEIGEARRCYAAHREALVSGLSRLDQRLLERWQPKTDDAPLAARLSALGASESDQMLRGWSLARLLEHLANCEVAAFFDDRERATQALFSSPGVA